MSSSHHELPEDISSIAPSVSAPITSPPTKSTKDLPHNHQRPNSRLSNKQQQQPAAFLLQHEDDDDDEGDETSKNAQLRDGDGEEEEVRNVRRLPNDFSFRDQKNTIGGNNRNNHAANVRRLRHNHAGISFGRTVSQSHLANCPVLNEELDEIMAIRRCTCTRKAPMLNLRREIATIRSNEDRHSKTQNEQLRQYKDEAKHLAKISRAFREENARLQRILEDKSRTAAEAEERVSKEHRRVADIDDKCQAWFVKLDDLREENDLLAEMSNKSRSEADHLRAALEQAMSENLKLRTALAQTHEQQQQQQSRHRTPSPTNTKKIGGLLPPSTSSYLQSHQQQPQQQQSKQSTSSSAAVGLVEDVNALRQAVKELKLKCKCSGGNNNNNSNNSPPPRPVSNNNNNNNNCGTDLQSQQQRDCSVPLGSHKYSTATASGGAIYTPSEKLERALDQIRHRVHSIDKELQTSKQEEERWRKSALEMKSILDSQQHQHQQRGITSSSPSSSSSPFSHNNNIKNQDPSVISQLQQRIRELERQLHQQEQQQYGSPAPSNCGGGVFGTLTRIKSAPSNVHSATADVTNLEAQLQYAKGQIATLDFQLQTLQKHMNSEMEKLKKEKDEEVAAARSNAAQEVEASLREEMLQTTSGAFLEELSTKLQRTEKRLQTLEVSHTTSEATKRQQQAEIENLRSRLEKETAIAIQLEPTQRALAQAEKERDASQIKLNHLENSIQALRESEARCGEEIELLRNRCLRAESQVEELHASLNSTSLKLHQEIESNKDLRQRLDETVERSNSIVRESKRVFEEELGETRSRLNEETNQRVNIEARASALECNLKSVREEVERIRRVQLHW